MNRHFKFKKTYSFRDSSYERDKPLRESDLKRLMVNIPPVNIVSKITSFEKERNFQHRLRNYGISEDFFAYLKKIQNNQCAICENDFDKVKINIDHNHKTKIVRGLLCSKCNSGIAFFKENIEILKKAIKYLKV